MGWQLDAWKEMIGAWINQMKCVWSSSQIVHQRVGRILDINIVFIEFSIFQNCIFGPCTSRSNSTPSGRIRFRSSNSILHLVEFDDLHLVVFFNGFKTIFLTALFHRTTLLNHWKVLIIEFDPSWSNSIVLELFFALVEFDSSWSNSMVFSEAVLEPFVALVEFDSSWSNSMIFPEAVLELFFLWSNSMVEVSNSMMSPA